MKKIAFIGFGNMGAAIAGGLISNGIVPAEDICASDLFREKVESAGVRYCGTPEEAAADADVILLCVKPNQVADVVDRIRSVLAEDKVIISIAAGVRAESISDRIGEICPVVRVLPNLPLMAGNGTTVIARPAGISDKDYEFAKMIFSSIGICEEIPADRFNEALPVSSSSPAFFFLLVDMIAEEAARFGIDRESAVRLAANTMKGSADMILNGTGTPAELADRVCSKKGTTIAALDAMREAGIREAFRTGFERCIERGYELAGE